MNGLDSDITTGGHNPSPRCLSPSSRNESSEAVHKPVKATLRASQGHVAQAQLVSEKELTPMPRDRTPKSARKRLCQTKPNLGRMDKLGEPAAWETTRIAWEPSAGNFPRDAFHASRFTRRRPNVRNKSLQPCAAAVTSPADTSPPPWPTPAGLERPDGRCRPLAAFCREDWPCHG